MNSENWDKFREYAGPWFKWGMIICVILLIAIFIIVTTSSGMRQVVLMLAGMLALGTVFHFTLGASFIAGMYGVGGAGYAVGAGVLYYAVGYKLINISLAFISSFLAQQGASAAILVATTEVAKPVVSPMVGGSCGMPHSPMEGGPVNAPMINGMYGGNLVREGMIGGCGCGGVGGVF